MDENASLRRLLQSKWICGLTWEGFLSYSRKNIDAMRANYEKTQIDKDAAAAVESLAGEVRLLAIGADWCGDVVANLPPIARLAALSRNIELRVLDRDAHDDLMAHFLTDGGKAIPKVIVCAANMASREAWGPRPAACQAIMTENKGKIPKEEIYPLIHAWYARDQNQTLIREIMAAIERQGAAA